jgi:hypothetical protein
MADNFNMKKFLAENKLGPYAKARLNEESNKQKLIDAGYSESDAEDFADEFEQGGSKVPQKVKDILTNKKEKSNEDIGGNIGDAEAEKEMDFLAEKETEEGYMGTQYDSSEDMAADMIKKGITREEKEDRMDEDINEAVDNRTLMKVEQLQDMLSNLKSNTATNSNIPTRDKQLLLKSFLHLEELLEDVGADIEMEMDDTYIPNSGELNERLSLQAFGRMSQLSNFKAQQAMIRAAEIMMNDLTAEGFEVEEIREFFTQLIANDI